LSSKHDRYSKEELVKIIEDRDRKPTFGLVWERDDIDFDFPFVVSLSNHDRKIWL